MKTLHVSDNLLELQILKDLLEERGIATHIPGELLTGATGELPARIFYELQLVNDTDQEAARRAIEIYQQQNESPGGAWRCQHCGELHEGSFTQCWKCGATRDTNGATD